MTVAALIVAAGRGARMGATGPKALLPLGGTSILARAVAAFAARPRVGRLVVVVADPEPARAALGDAAGRVLLVRGGEERQDSVLRGLEAVRDSAIVLVHDAARPLVPATLIDAVLDAAIAHGAAVPVLPVVDTVKRIGSDGVVLATVPRDDLRLAQTPQGFRTELLTAAYASASREGVRATDDSGLVERCGGRVVAVPGSPRNIKITTPADLALAEALLRGEATEGEILG
jgi:2-C-methyl-D-erythritol 4-phosphate cytidylyltransferase